MQRYTRTNFIEDWLPSFLRDGTLGCPCCHNRPSPAQLLADIRTYYSLDVSAAAFHAYHICSKCAHPTVFKVTNGRVYSQSTIGQGDYVDVDEYVIHGLQVREEGDWLIMSLNGEAWKVVKTVGFLEKIKKHFFRFLSQCLH